MAKTHIQIKEDVNGRLHSLDQGQRSLEKRLRAVERRLSMGDIPEAGDIVWESEAGLEEELESLKEDILALSSGIDELKAGSKSALLLKTELQDAKNSIMELKQELDTLGKENSGLRARLEQDSDCHMEQLSTDINARLEQLNTRLDKAEKRDRINIGSMKVPVELSGIVGAAILILTGVLITQGKWEIIRSANFSFGIALVLAAAVMLKFYVANRSAE